MIRRTRSGLVLRLGVLWGIVAVASARPPRAAHAAERDDATETAQQILEATGVTGGLVVHLGCGDGRVTAALRAGDRFLVHGLDADPQDVTRARQQLQARGVYGPVSIDRLSGDRLPYAENVVNLLVAEAPGEVTLDEMMRVLVPRGVALVREGEERTPHVKPWPDDLDEWTHWLHDASGNAVARDRVVGPPRRLQWVAGPRWSRHHNTTPSLNAAVSAGGRIFYISDDAPPGFDNSLPDRYHLYARDAFNGVLLWKIPINDWGWAAWVQTMYTNFMLGRHMHPIHIQRRLVAVGDRVYATLGFNAPVSELDAASGDVLRTFEGTDCTSEILFHDGKLVLAVNKEPQHAGFIDQDPPVKKEIKMIDVDSGKLVWEAGQYAGISVRGSPVQRVTQVTMAVGPEGVFLLEEDAVVGLDHKTGEEMWRVPRPARPEHKVVDGYRNDHTNLCSLVYYDGRVLFGQPHEQDKKPPWNTTQPSHLLAIDATTGDVEWRKQIGNWEYGTPIGIYVVDGRLWVHAHPDEPFTLLALDPADGRELRRISTRAVFDSGHHHRCTRNKATERFLITSRRGVELTGFADGSTQVNQWIRGECGYGMMPCNGLIYTTPHPCKCFIEEKLSGLYALAPERKAESGKRKADQAPRLERGPAHGQPIHHSSFSIHHSHDWPTYRHDPARSGATTEAVPAELKPAWATDLGAAPSAPVVAGGMVFVAAVEQHRVCALDANDGKLLWSFTAGGRVDTPPTIHRGLALFGSRDGCVYCLRATDGELVWRLRATPEDRRTVAFDGVESLWPVHGSVLVVEGVAYCAAGRSSHLDGGIHLLALDPASGAILREQTLDTAPAAAQDKGGRGALADVLVFDGRSISMRQNRFEPVAVEGRRPWSKDPRHLLATGGLLDDTWFNRIYWALNNRPLGQMFVFDEDSAYGIRSYPRPGDVNAHFVPGKQGYRLFAHDYRKPPAAPRPGEKPKRRRNAPPEDRWGVTVPIRARAFALAAETLFLAGTPDTVDADDPWASFDGRRGGLLRAVATADGKTLAEYRLDAPPVYDGLAAARGRLYLSTTDGAVRCFAGD
jgi:outer membrane protein assembly factor BamB